MVLGRLLEPRDFGLVGMVATFTGALSLFRDFGISSATVHRTTITDEQHTTLFWINILIGTILTTICAAMAGFVASFYHEPRLVSVTAWMSISFLLNSAGVQHSALLQRQMCFTASALVEVVALVASIGTGIGMAMTGFGYWSLVGMTVVSQLVSTIMLWCFAAWVPGLPRRGADVWSMMRFGGAITLNSVIVYLAYNLEKLLLGRYWGADALGIYGRAYQLVNIPTENLNAATGGVAFAALSRLRDEPRRFNDYFLKGYSLVLAVTIPATVVGALYADDLIYVVLGPKWTAVAGIFRLLAPTILTFALINPLSWLLFSLGLVGRSLKLALVLTPLVITGYVIGLPYGPNGVALGYSATLALWVVPHIIWSLHGTVVRVRDLFVVVARPAISGALAAAVALVLNFAVWHPLSPLPRLVCEALSFLGAYALILIFGMNQRRFYAALVAEMFGRRGSATLSPQPVAVGSRAAN